MWLLLVAVASFALVQAEPIPDLGKIDAEGCGQRPLARDDNIDPFIVNGTTVSPYTWPFICSLQTSSGSHFCGGQLVKNKVGTYFFLTAAHCITPSSVPSYRIACSIHDIRQSNYPTHAQIFTFSSVVRHPQYNSNTLINDIAVGYLNSQPVENNYLQPVCIPLTTYSAGEMSTVLGWGRLSSSGSSPNFLQGAQKPIVSDATCAGAYGNAFRPGTMMCAGYAAGGVDACQGDSGGPLVVYRNGAWKLVGIVSWGYGCAAANAYGVYANVIGLKTWINSMIN